MKQNHPFHLVDISPWPLTGAIGSMALTSGSLNLFHNLKFNILMMGILIILMTMFQWWRDVTRESTFQGHHSIKVYFNMRMGMILFIISEIFFFFSFFWAFFHSSLSPSVEIGLVWPPKGILTFNPMEIPLLNSIILISSGISITWAHHALINNNFNQTLNNMILTAILGIYFSILQAMEYFESPFTFSDSVYGSSFFMATGFHGIHVLIGTTFIIMMTIRHYNNHFIKNHHMGFEAAAWYWHFVDVVWLFLYISIYWWGS